jgi:HK97 family phage portal protein
VKLLGFEITKARAPVDARPPSAWGDIGWHRRWISGVVSEPFTGAWQRNIEVECQENVLAFSAVYACVGLISDDISKLRIKLVEQDRNGIWKETSSAAFSPVLRKPNRYQTRIQFLSQWIVSKLLWGNTYILKERDQRKVVVAMYVLDPARVTPMVTPDGDVWYRLRSDRLAQVPGENSDNEVMIPASEVIHDRMLALYHPLVGVSPIYACGASATQGIRIQSNSETFFRNSSRPGGVILIPPNVADEHITAMRDYWQSQYGGENAGKTAVLTEGAKFEGFSIPAQDAQLIEQLRWTVEDVARCFHVPLHKLGMGQPTLNNINALNQDYYTQTLQALIESIEVLLDEGLALPPPLGSELDLEGLLRMDPQTLADVNEKGIRAGYLAPNEARLRFDLGPVEGGDTPYMQQQNWSLEALNQRPAPSAAGSQVQPAPASAPDQEEQPEDDKPEDKAVAILERVGEVIALKFRHATV